MYTRRYSIEALRARTERYIAPDSFHDLWEGLKQTFRLFRDEPTASKLGLTPLDGELFGPLSCPDLEDACCSNAPTLEALFHLSRFEDRTERRKRTSC